MLCLAKIVIGTANTACMNVFSLLGQFYVVTSG